MAERDDLGVTITEGEWEMGLTADWEPYLNGVGIKFKKVRVTDQPEGNELLVVSKADHVHMWQTNECIFERIKVRGFIGTRSLPLLRSPAGIALARSLIFPDVDKLSQQQRDALWAELALIASKIERLL